MEENKRISDLFDRARNEAPKTSFEVMKGHFLAASSVAGTGLLAKWAAASFKLKALIMVTTSSILTFSGIFISSQFATNTDIKKAKQENTPQNQVEIIEIRTEDGVQKTTVYNEKNEVLKVELDSSKKTKQQTENIQMEPLEANTIDFQTSPKKVPVSLEPPVVKTSKASDSLMMKNFKIDERTTKSEIEKMQQQAIAAGLEFTFDAKIRQSKIKRLHLQMKKGSSKWTSKITGTDSFSFTFGWWEDETGKFVRFICDKDLKMECGGC